MIVSHYTPDRVRELCAMNVKELDKELLNLSREITQPTSIHHTSADVSELIWKMAFIQRIQNQKRKNPARIVPHVQMKDNEFIIEHYQFS